MKAKLLCVSILISILFSFNTYGAWNPVEWKTPLTRFAELDLDPEEISILAGDGQLVITLNPQTLSIWTKKKGCAVNYPNARVGYALMVVDASPEKIRLTVRDLLGTEYMPLLKEGKILSKKKNHTMVRFTQVIDLPILKLNQKFIYQHTECENGDIAGLLHHGDIGAMVTHYEFFPLENGKTLFVMATWQDLETAGFAFRMFLKAEPAFKTIIPSMGAAAYVEQFSAAATETHMGESESVDGSQLPMEPSIPFLTKNQHLPIETLMKLSELGTIQFFHPRQRVNFKGKILNVPRSTAIARLNYPVSKVKPLYSDLSRLQEYHPLFRGYESVEETGTDYSILKMGFHVGPILLPSNSPIYESWINENIKIFRGTGKGHVEPLACSTEFIETPDKNTTFVTFTYCGVIGDEAPFYLKLMRTIPMVNQIIAGGFSLLTADHATGWFNLKLGSENSKDMLYQNNSSSKKDIAGLKKKSKLIER